MAIKRIFFDLDGTLVNSDKIFWQSNFEVLDTLKIKINKKNIWKRYLTESYGLTEILKESGYSAVDIKNIKKERGNIYKNLLKKNVEYLPRVLNTLDYLKKKDLSLWIVTTNSDEFISIINEKLELDKYFERIISRENIQNGKPNPEVYLLAIQESSPLKKEECISVEDTPKGVRSAHDAGLKCLFISNTSLNIHLNQCDFTKSHRAYTLIKSIDNMCDIY